MKTFFAIIGAFVCILILGVIVFAAVAAWPALNMERGATAYLNSNIPKIVGRWNAQDLLDRVTPELRSSAKYRAETEKMFLVFRQLGPLQRLGNSDGSVASQTTARFGTTGPATVTTGKFRVDGVFARGDAIMDIELRKVAGKWCITSFRVESDVFRSQKTSTSTF